MSTPPSFAAFVPMKGHSERVPGKNIREFAGRPLYHWVVSALLDVEGVSTVLVDTDSDEIADDVSTHFPAVRVVWRPEDLRGDFVAMHDILRYDVTQVREDFLLQTHSTNPLLKAETIGQALQAFLSDDASDSLYAVTPLQTRLYWPDGRPINHDPAELKRTQDLDPVYEENSNLYVFTRDAIDRTGQRVGTRPQMFPMDPMEAVDIDEEFDFVIAEMLMQRRLQRQEAR